MTQLGNNIRHHREKNRYTRKGLSKLVGCSQCHIYALENGIVKNPRSNLLRELAQVFGVTIESLLEEEV